MKKLIILGLLIVGGMLTVPTVATAQTYGRNTAEIARRTEMQQRERDRREMNQRNERVYRPDRHRGWGVYNRSDNQVTVVNEYRNVRIGRRVYRETYRTTYTRRGGFLVSRVLVNRESLERYDRYNDRDFRREGFRFNVFLKF